MAIKKKLVEYHELKCKRCGKEIKGRTEGQADHNLRVHMMSHEYEDERQA